MIFIMTPPTKLLVTGAACLATLMTAQAQSLNPTPSISNAGAVNSFTGGYTFAYATSGSPWNGALISFGGFNNTYDCQLSTDYGSGGRHISFRTRNGDAATWNPWYEIWNSAHLNNSTSDFNAQNIFAYGNVGIGTASPLTKFDVKLTTNQHIQFTNDVNGAYTGTAGIVSINDANTAYTPLGFYASNYYFGLGHVLIGKTSQTNSAYVLDVAGSIRSSQVVVNTTGADFVFVPAYRLNSLPGLKKYINSHHHLPEIPSAKIMRENGLNVGDTEIKLLQKIEELTLYAVENDRKNKDLETKLAAQQAVNRSEEARIKKLEQEMELLLRKK